MLEPHSLYQAITESMREGVFTVDFDYRYTTFNPVHKAAMKRIYDVEIELGHTVFEYLPTEEDRVLMRNYLDQAFQGETRIVVNTVEDTPTGVLYLVVTHQPLKDENGKVIGACVVAGDITEPRNNELRLAESEQRYRLIFSESPVGIVRYDRKGILVDANESVLNVLEVSKEDLIGFDLLGGLKDPVMIEAIAHSLKGEQGFFTGPYTTVTSGKKLFLRMVTRPLFSEETVIGGIGILEDVTERVLTQQALEESRERYRLLFSQSPVGIMRFNNDGVLVAVNEAAIHTFGSTREKLIGFNSLESVKNQKMLDAVLASLNGEEGFFEGDYTSVTSGKKLVLRMITRPVYQDGKVDGGLGIFEDVTERVRSAEALRDSEERYRSLVEKLPVGVMVYNGKGIVFANPTCADWLGFSGTADMVGISPLKFLLENEHQAALELSAAGLRREFEIKNQEMRFHLENGEVLDVAVSIVPITYQGEPCIQATFSNITQQKNLERELHHLATHDSLTGLPNRATLADRLEHSLEHALRYKDRLAVLFMDLNDFKLVNDTYGHSTGDKLLQGFAQRLRAGLRGVDTVARFAGDEFVVLLEDLGIPPHAEVVAEKILKMLEEPFELGEKSFQVNVSIGISVYPESGTDAETLLRNADIAMYCAKNSPTEDYCFYRADVDMGKCDETRRFA